MQYLIVQQKKLEAALTADVRTLAELSEALVFARPELPAYPISAGSPIV
jgi:hypothetical protein